MFTCLFTLWLEPRLYLYIPGNPRLRWNRLFGINKHSHVSCNQGRIQGGGGQHTRAPPKLLKDSEFFGIFYYFSSFGTILFIIPFSESPFARKNLRNRNAFSHQTSHTCRPLPLIVHTIFFERIRITILDLKPEPCFQTFLIISKTYHQIFKCNTSKRRSGQELLFIFFELRAATCLWGRYDPKTENFTYFYIYIFSHPLPFKRILCPCKELS